MMKTCNVITCNNFVYHIWLGFKIKFADKQCTYFVINIIRTLEFGLVKVQKVLGKIYVLY